MHWLLKSLLSLTLSFCLALACSSQEGEQTRASRLGSGNSIAAKPEQEKAKVEGESGDSKETSPSKENLEQKAKLTPEEISKQAPPQPPPSISSALATSLDALQKGMESGEHGFKLAAKLQTAQGYDLLLLGLLESKEKVFSFAAPAELEAVFSTGFIARNSAPSASEVALSCSAFTYKNEAATLEEVIDVAKRNNTCGEVSVTYCARIYLKSEGEEGKNNNFTYLLSPPMKVTLPCSDKSLQNASLTLDNGAPSTNKNSVNVQIQAGPLASEVYLTNQPDCQSGGVWEPLVAEKLDWPLLWNADKSSAAVFAKFKDRLFAKEGSCIAVAITYLNELDLPPPSEE